MEKRYFLAPYDILFSTGKKPPIRFLKKHKIRCCFCGMYGIVRGFVFGQSDIAKDGDSANPPPFPLPLDPRRKAGRQCLSSYGVVSAVRPSPIPQIEKRRRREPHSRRTPGRENRGTRIDVHFALSRTCAKNRIEIPSFYFPLLGLLLL